MFELHLIIFVLPTEQTGFGRICGITATSKKMKNKSQKKRSDVIIKLTSSKLCKLLIFL